MFFDFDGVIVESVDIKVAAFRGLYADQGEDVIAKVLAHHHEHGGISRVVKIRDCHRMFLGIDLDDAEVAELAASYARLVEDAVCACDAVPGALEFLSKNDGRWKIFAVSGTPQDELRRITDRRGLTKYFDAVYGSPRGKEEIIEDVLGRYDRMPAESVMVGDTMTDYRAAMATGVPFIGRVDPVRENPFPSGVRVVPDLAGLAALIGGG